MRLCQVLTTSTWPKAQERLAYRKGFETGVGLIIEYWSKGKSKESALDVSVKVISMLEEQK